MIKPARRPLEILSGTDFEFVFRLKLDGVPTMTQGTLLMQVRKRPGRPPVLSQTVNGSTGPDHWVRFWWPASVTAGVDPGSYVYGVDWTDVAGRVQRLFESTVTISPDVTS